MAIDNQTVKRVAFLSRLKVEDAQLDKTKEEFNGILAWVGQLDEVDTTSVDPLVSVNEDQLRTREDVVNDGHLKAEVLQNAPMQEYGYFAVPKVVE